MPKKRVKHAHKWVCTMQPKRVAAIWGAEWKVAPMRDPLVIGTVGEFHFLVDQWDATKLERYVMAEFVQKPEG